jgi:hypothetical protein
MAAVVAASDSNATAMHRNFARPRIIAPIEQRLLASVENEYRQGFPDRFIFTDKIREALCEVRSESMIATFKAREFHGAKFAKFGVFRGFFNVMPAKFGVSGG